MANTTISPNMGLPVPNVGVDPGPDWANNLNACLSTIDGHNHTPGNGVQIPPAGLNINSDLPFGQNNATQLRAVRFTPQATISAVTPDLDELYVNGVDLYYIDGNGNTIRITQSGSVAGASGTITGLPSGTASAAFVPSSGTFVFSQATSEGANMDIGSLILRYPGSYPTPSGNYISFEAPSSLSTGFSFVLPNNTPLYAQSAIVSDTSGNLSYLDPDQIGEAMSSTGANAVLGSSTNANMGGNSVQENGRNLVVSGTNASTSLQMIRGVVGPGGEVVYGEGWSCSQTGTGSYQINFSPAFSSIPVVIATAEDLSGTIASAQFQYSALANTSCVITTQTSGGRVSMHFSFIAIGPR